MHTPRMLSNQRGFTLVELMVGLVVGLLLLSALGALFVNTSQSNVEFDKSVRQIENARHGMDLLREDIATAGYYGDLLTEDLSFSTPAACATAIANLGWDNSSETIPTPVTGLNGTETAALTCLSSHKANTPALVLRRVDTARLAVTAAGSGSPFLQTSRCKNDPSDTRFVLSDAAAGLTLRNLDCSAANQVQRYITRIYYVSTCNECGLDTTPTLKRAELIGGTFSQAPLAEGIEDLAFEFGFDTDGDGSADTFNTSLSCTAGAADNDWSNVVGVRIRMLSATIESTPGFSSSRTFDLGLLGTRGPFNDGLKRRVYAMTVRLNNVAGPREQP